MKYNDNELIALCSEGNEEAKEILINKYNNVINYIIKNVMNSYTITGEDYQDLYQECLYGFLKAIDSFNPKKDVVFFTYASTCIKTSLMNILRNINTNKNSILNTSISYDDVDNEYLLKDNTNIEDIILTEEEKNSLLDKINKTLNEKEKELLELKLSGFSNTEISLLLNRNKKYVENTLTRIRAKIKKIK